VTQSSIFWKFLHVFRGNTVCPLAVGKCDLRACFLAVLRKDNIGRGSVPQGDTWQRLENAAQRKSWTFYETVKIKFHTKLPWHIITGVH
jgi:hypothetical protein